MWPFGAGGINYHFVYWPGHLNVKVLPDFTDKCEAHYDEFIEWWKENWRLEFLVGIKTIQNVHMKDGLMIVTESNVKGYA